MAWRWRSQRGKPCMEMKITMGRPRTWRWRSPCAVKKGYTIPHIYKLHLDVYPVYAPFFCMVDVSSRVIPQRMSIINASPRFRRSLLGQNPLWKYSFRRFNLRRKNVWFIFAWNDRDLVWPLNVDWTLLFHDLWIMSAATGRSHMVLPLLY